VSAEAMYLYSLLSVRPEGENGITSGCSIADFDSLDDGRTGL
jgi:hypothetical protein